MRKANHFYKPPYSMNRQILTPCLWVFSLVLFGFMPTLAQKTSKLNVDLYLRLMDLSPLERSRTEIPLLVKGDISKLKQLIDEEGGIFKYSVKNMASVQWTAEQILAYAQKDFVWRMEAYRAPMHYFSDPEDSIMQQNNNVQGAHQGWGDLPQPYQGEGVLVGVIDNGLDFRHPDFLDSNGNTRVLYLWDQNTYDTDYLETDYAYGSTWNAPAIDSGQCRQLAGTHGTHVAGLAVGNGQAASKYPGIAPKSAINIVKVLETSDWMTGFVDGLHFFFQKADELNLPCVVNSSLGTYTSGHDGQDLYSQLIDAMLAEKPGRVLVQAGGNSREYAYHLGMQSNMDTIFTRFKRHSSGRTLFYMYGDTADLNRIDFSFQLLENNTERIKMQTRTYNLKRNTQFRMNLGTFSELLFFDQQERAVYLDVYTSVYDKTYETLVVLGYDDPDDIWQMAVVGNGYFDIWSDQQHTKTSDIVTDVDYPKYINPDNEQTIAGFWACSQNAITVAAYQNRDSLHNYQGNTIPLSRYPVAFPKYGIWFRSSLGPTRDGRLKPEIGAPGGQVMAAAPLSCLPPNFCGGVGYNIVDVDGWHVSNQGTSMAAPMVAGAVALYLQCQADANFERVRAALTNSARIDSFVLRQTGGTPNIHWGWGKLDVYELVKECLVYGCTDTLASSYNAMANVSDTSFCTYAVANRELASAYAYYQVHPNPAREHVQIRYSSVGEAGLELEFTLVDVLGRVLNVQQANQKSGALLFDTRKLARGVYYIQARVAGRLERVDKLVVIP